MIQNFDNDARPVMVIGGPYSNLRATVAAKAEAERLGIPPERVICTGDVVAYCCEPDETSRLIAEWGCHVIQGNCEQQIAAGADDCACNFEDGSACAALAKGWYPYAAAHTSDEMRRWMGQLPDTFRFTMGGLNYRVVHGAVSEINRWVFASDKDLLSQECALDPADVIIAGHCGVPFITRSGRQTWFNAGVVGMPANDGTPDVWYGLITPTEQGALLSTHRLAYDHHGAAAALRRAGHANGYARTLITGLWPSLDMLPQREREQTGRRLRATRLALKSPSAMAA